MPAHYSNLFFWPDLHGNNLSLSAIMLIIRNPSLLASIMKFNSKPCICLSISVPRVQAGQHIITFFWMRLVFLQMIYRSLCTLSHMCKFILGFDFLGVYVSGILIFNEFEVSYVISYKNICCMSTVISGAPLLFQLVSSITSFLYLFIFIFWIIDSD